MRPKKHCFKCNHFKPLVGGVKVRTSNGRERFVCGGCEPRASNQIVLRYVAKPAANPAESPANATG